MQIEIVFTVGVVTSILLQPVEGFAWGTKAHTAICEIAFQELKGPARNEVKRLIRRDDEFRFFARFCTWPDNPRQRLRSTA